MCHTVQVGGTSEVVEDNTIVTNQQQQQQQSQQQPLMMTNSPLPMSPLAQIYPQPQFNDQETYDFYEVNEDELEAVTNLAAVTNLSAVKRMSKDLPGVKTSGDSNPLLSNGATENDASVSDQVDNVARVMEEDQLGNTDFQNELKSAINNFKSEGMEKVMEKN